CSDSSAEVGNTAEGSDGATQETLTVGVEPVFAPYVFEEDGKYVGTEVDLLTAVADELDMEIEFERIGFDSLIPSLSAGRVDVTAVGGWNDSPERRDAMNMVAYFTAYSGL